MSLHSLCSLLQRSGTSAEERKGISSACLGLGSPCGVSGDEVTSAAAEEGQAESGHPKLSYMEVQRD